jgi:hypothetical protein
MTTFVWRPAKKFVNKNDTKTIHVATVGRDIIRPVAFNDQSNIYHFKKQTVKKLTSEAKITHDMHQVLL